MKKYLLLILLLSFVISATNAKTLSLASNTKITTVSSYSEYGSGDVIVKVDNPAEGCKNGFWLGGNDPGIKNILALVLSANATGANVTINGDKDRMWPGSQGSYCHLYSINI